MHARAHVATGPEIVSTSGKVIWFHPLPPGSDATDFRAQTYLGKPVLTWFQMVDGVGEGVIDNDRYQQMLTELREIAKLFTKIIAEFKN